MSFSKNISDIDEFKIAVIGLGYVGLPLAIEFAKKYDVLGFDTNETRIAELKQATDRTNEANIDDLKMLISESPNNGKGLHFSYTTEDLRSYNTFIITVPTPIDRFKAPDLTALIKASEMVGTVIKKDDIIIYESTVYPGCTEDDCIPVVEEFSGLKLNKDFFAGYSPERVNPGDKVNTLIKIKKVTSGSTPEIAEKIDRLYQSIIIAGTHMAPNIKTAEASKAIENAQRDINISFVNELSLIFDRIGIDTNDVIDAAGTKWNFIKYKPGLVGGHCICVDPYYLAHKAQMVGYNPQVILSGRKVNDQMGAFVANKVVKLMIQKDQKIKGAKALIMGITFKENCADVRNTRVMNIYYELSDFGLQVDIYDPLANVVEVRNEYNVGILKQLDELAVYDAIIVAVAHKQFLNFNYQNIKKPNCVIYDTKGCLDRALVDGRL